MPMPLLCTLASSSLPCRVDGDHLSRVEALSQAGLVVATVYREGRDLLSGYAIVHDITTMGLRYVDAFGPGAARLADAVQLPGGGAPHLT